MSAKMVKEEIPNLEIEMKSPRCRGPEHFLLKVESFSESQMEKYESHEFQAGGYKWKLILYPNGDKERNGNGHISLYLSISDTQNLPSGWEVEADFSLFVYNGIIRKYQTYKLAGKTWFNWLKLESGFAQLMPLNQFKDTSNGFLFGDACVFGAEVFVTNCIAVAKRQTLSLKNKINNGMSNNFFSWNVGNLSASNSIIIASEKFMIKDVQWNLQIYPPKGNYADEDRSITVNLRAAGYETKKLEEHWKVMAKFRLRIRNELSTNHVEEQTTNVFRNSLRTWGFTTLIPAYDKSKTFLKNDNLVAEVEITKVEIIK